MKKGFTLAEVLITLGIIGVVASVTLPSLNNNVQKQTYEVGAKKAFNIIANAVGLYMVDQGINDLSEAPLYNNKDGVKNFVNKYFKTSIDCGDVYYSTTKASCFPEKIYSLDHSVSQNMIGSGCMQSVMLSDGMSMCFDSNTIVQDKNDDGSIKKDDNGNDLMVYNPDYDDNIAMTVEVDINGPTGPNVTGRDLFTYYVRNNGQVGSNKKDCDTTTQDGRDKCVAHFKKNAYPMPIGLLQYYGWKMKY